MIRFSNYKLALLIVLGLCLTTTVFGDDRKKKKVSIPDFTQGDQVPAGHDHVWNLGPTGAIGWIYTEAYGTSKARQILITEVAQNSPSQGILQIGDVILGVGKREFEYDPRIEFGKAIGEAEASRSGRLELMVWRGGRTKRLKIQLEVLGRYSDTAPFNCEKSDRIFERGCLAQANMLQNWPKERKSNRIVSSYAALALLASGREEYLPLVQKEVAKAAKYSDTEGKNLCSWFYGPTNLLIAEYTMATGDRRFLPALERISLEIVDGQSNVGSWGHRFSQPNGVLKGYGMMNSAGLPLIHSLVMAKGAGVKSSKLDEGIEKSVRMIEFYAGKGSIPYGDHDPWTKSHAGNGKNGSAALLFNLLNDKYRAEYFSKSSIAAYGNERERGHTGNYFNILFAMPGVALSGPEATGAWMQRFGWYYDLARRHDGTFMNQGQAIPGKDKHKGWDATGPFLLAYAQAYRNIYFTGRKKNIVRDLTRKEAEEIIADGQPLSEPWRGPQNLSDKQVLEKLASWSPIIREKMAKELTERNGNFIPALTRMLKSDSLEVKRGACTALAMQGNKAAPAVKQLRYALSDEDMWVRVLAAKAIASTGQPGRVAIPQLLKMLTQNDRENDPRQMEQRYLTQIIFDSKSGLLKKSLKDVKPKALYAAVKASLQNEDGNSRQSIASVYKNLNYNEIKPLLPAIEKATREAAPSGVMFSHKIRVSGVELFSKHRIKEGMQLCIDVMALDQWNSPARISQCLKALGNYGGNAKPILPQLVPVRERLVAGANKGNAKAKSQLKLLDETVAKIRNDKNPPKLRSL